MFEGCGGCCLALVLIPVLCCVLVVGAIIYVYSTAPDPPLSDNFKASQVEADQFDQMISTAKLSAQSQGWFYLQFNERQISSWMALEGEDFAKQQDNTFPFKNMQVGLGEGRMTFYGELRRYGLKLPFKIEIQPQIDNQGKVKMEIKTARLGGLVVPQFVLKSVSAQFEDVLIKPFDDLPGSYALYKESLSIQSGSFVVQGTIVQ
jgi:uncharacterized protein YpmS